MVVVLLAAPCLLAQLIYPQKPLLRATPRAIVAVITAALVLLSASRLPGLSRVLVPSAFLLGGLALTSVAWTSSRSRIATGLAATGALCNLIPIAILGAMPVVVRSRSVVAAEPIVESTWVSAKHQELRLASFGDYVLGAFGDWIPLPGLGAVVSMGDIVLIAALVAIGLSHRSQARPQPFVESVSAT